MSDELTVEATGETVGEAKWAALPDSRSPLVAESLALLDALLALEARFGRRRGARNAARTLDLDLLDYDGLRLATPRLLLPHPRLAARRFVLAPLAEIAPGWRHPSLGRRADALLARLPPGQGVRALGERRRQGI